MAVVFLTPESRGVGQDYVAPQAPIAAPDKFAAFLDGMTARHAARTRASLETVVRWNGAEVMSRAAFIERAVGDERTIETVRGERRLAHPSGVFLDERAITKTGMDYAAFLLDQKARA